MRRSLPVRRPATARAGFTLAEVAVTLLIVAFALVLISQGLTTAKTLAADTHYRKVARELALLTLGRIEAGLFWEELDGGGDVLTGTYAEEDYEDFHYELVLGEEDFSQSEDRYEDDNTYHDSWEAAREREDRLDEDDDDEEDEVAEPFEKVRIRVTYPKFGEKPGELVLERWIAWDQVYGNEEGEEAPPGEESK